MIYKLIAFYLLFAFFLKKNRCLSSYKLQKGETTIARYYKHITSNKNLYNLLRDLVTDVIIESNTATVLLLYYIIVNSEQVK